MLIKYFFFTVEVIQTDPDFRDIAVKNNMYNGGGEIPIAQQPASISQSAQQIRRYSIIKDST